MLLFCKQSEFIEKDNDALHSDLEHLIQDSKDAFLKSLFPGVVQKKTEIGSMTFGGAIKPSSKKLAFISVGSKFRVTFPFTPLFCFVLVHVHLLESFDIYYLEGFAPQKVSKLFAGSWDILLLQTCIS